MEVGQYISAIQLQKAIFASLSSVYPVYEVVPKNTKMPYISIGEFQKVPDITKTNKDRYQYTVMLHTWSRGHSSSESKAMNHFTLNQMNNLNVEGYSVEMVDLTLETTLREEEIESTIFHGALEFQIILSNQKGE